MTGSVFAEKHLKSYSSWLQFEAITESEFKTKYLHFCSNITVISSSEVIDTAVAELKQGIQSMLGKEPQISKNLTEGGILIGTTDSLNDANFDLSKIELSDIGEEGYIIKAITNSGNPRLLLTAKTDKGLLHAAFHLLRELQCHGDISRLSIIENPKNRLRMINHWDNIDGSIERGYAGKSIFYNENKITSDTKRIKDYARMLASVGINAISLNNVNVHEVETNLITETYLDEVAKLADIFRTYGIQTFLSINYASPIQLSDITTADPLDENVRNWWKEQAKVIYNYIPDFGGFLVKADSEHRPGPFTYGRNHADGANMLAEALAPYNGIVIWRCFVYNCLQDWRDRSTDRARAAYDHFKPLDGEFLSNVILQIKNGPMDFQVREANSPLFGAMEKTNQMLEFQITQEYTGQQRHLCYLIPQWKEILEFDTFAKDKGSKIKNIVDGSLFGYEHSGIAAVVNVGLDYNWTGHTLAQANLYGYGRLIWNPDLEVETITTEWIQQTFGHDVDVQEKITYMLLNSWGIYENYTAPLGVGWMVNPNHHYGPNVDGYEYDRWGTYHFADWKGIGVDRTVQSGTRYTSQYFKENMEMYESLATCPDELLLFFHHVPYTHQLKSGETVIQHIYNTHFEGVEQAGELVSSWQQLEGKIDSERYQDVLARLTYQAEHAKEWRDIINTYFYRKSGIADEKNRKIY